MLKRGVRIFRTDDGWAVVRAVRDAVGEPMRVLSVDGVYQSATYFGDRRFELPFEYMRAFDRAFDAECDGLRVRRMLAIGGGGCSYPKHVAATRPDVHVDVVEHDARVADAARRHFFAGELEDAGRLRIYVADGLEFLGRVDDCYDVIVNDAFAGNRFADEFLKRDAVVLAKSRLTDGGVCLANVVCDDSPEGAAQLRHAMEAFAAEFAHVWAVCATDEGLSDRDNFVVIATDGDYAFEGAFSL